VQDGHVQEVPVKFLLTRVRLYFARRRIWRAVRAQAERREMLDPYRDDSWRRR